MKRAILWDNDGVLVNTERWFFEANRRVLNTLGVSVSWQEFEEINLLRGESLLPLSGLEGEALTALYAERDALYSRLLVTEDIVFPGVAELLAGLRDHCVMGIVTSSHREHFEIIHERSGLLEFFDFVCVREDYERGKPHPDGYRLGIGRAGCPAEACVAVEDSPRGVAAATAAGLECVVLGQAPVSEEAGIKRAASHEELGDVLGEMAAATKRRPPAQA